MSRILNIGAPKWALSPPIKPRQRGGADDRLLRQAKERGCHLVVFPELALTTFFPRYYDDDIGGMDHHFETEMPGPELRPLFDAAKAADIAFYLGYAGKPRTGIATPSILVDGDRIVGKYRKVHLPGHAEYDAKQPFQHLEKRYFEPGDLASAWRCKGDHGHGDLQRSPLAGNLSGDEPERRRSHHAWLQHRM